MTTRVMNNHELIGPILCVYMEDGTAAISNQRRHVGRVETHVLCIHEHLFMERRLQYRTIHVIP
jgi:hypothetical protein